MWEHLKTLKNKFRLSLLHNTDTSHSLESLTEVTQQSKKYAAAVLETLAQKWSDAPFAVFITGSFARELPTPQSDVDLIFYLTTDQSPQDFQHWIEKEIYPLYSIFGKVSHVFRSDSTLDEACARDYRVFYGLQEARSLQKSDSPKPWAHRVSPDTDQLLFHIQKRWNRFQFSPCHLQMDYKEGPGALMDQLNLGRLSLGSIEEQQPAIEFLHALRCLREQQKEFSIDTSCVEKLYETTTNAFQRLLNEMQDEHMRPPIQSMKDWLAIAQKPQKQFLLNFFENKFESILPVRHLLLTPPQSSTHLYTVGWHSAFMIESYKAVVSGTLFPAPPFLHEALQICGDPHSLLVACFLHDIGKQQRDIPHEQWGAQWAKKHLGAHAEVRADRIAWLIQNHLELHARAIKDDLNQESMIRENQSWLETPSQLAALYILTITDIIATNPKLWTAWRAHMLGRYFQTMAQAFNVPLFPMPSEPLQDFEESHINTQEELQIVFDEVSGFHVLIINIKRDCSGLLAHVLHTLFDLKIGVWKIRTRPTGANQTMDFIWIYPYSTARIQLSESRIQEIHSRMHTALEHFYTQKPKYFAPHLDQLKSAVVAATAGDIEIKNLTLSLKCQDRDGLLKDITEAIFLNGYNILSAHIGTTGTTAVDVFELAPNTIPSE